MRTILLALSMLLQTTWLVAQDAARVEFERQRTRALAENGQRHLQLGSWARDVGLVPQATAQFVLAVEVAEGKNPGAIQVLGIMRSLDERFWTQRRERPSRQLLDQFEKRARKALREDREARWKIAKFAHGRKLAAEALREYRAIVGAAEGPLEVDAKGRIVLDVGEVPTEVSAKILADAVEIDTRRYPREDTVAGMPDAANVHERSSPELRVRGTIARERIDDLHAVGLALLPHLEEHIGGRPVERVRVFVFATRAEYAVYLAANALQRFERASGFADYVPQQAIVCAEGCDEQGLRGLLLHELIHLYDFQVSPAALPSWYCEGFAESFAGPGAWSWTDGRLELGGSMSAAERDRLKSGIDGFVLKDLLAADAGALWGQDPAKASRFYVEARGFLEFVRRHAGAGVADRFATWEAACRGKAIGASPRQPGEKRRAPDAKDARELFEAMFAADLDALQRGFVEWANGDR